MERDMISGQKFGLKLRDGKFRVLCMSDLHADSEKNEVDLRTIRGIEALVKATDPDLVMFLGDLTSNSDGMGSVERLKAYITDISRLCEERKIPWAHIPGNHDREAGIPPEAFASYPHCLSMRGKKGLSGYGTYCLEVTGDDGKAAFVIYAFDSHTGIGAYAQEMKLAPPVELPNIPFCFDHYAGVYSDQAEWYYDMSCEYEKQAGHKVSGIILTHIPVTEYILIQNNPTDTGMDGEFYEFCCAQVINSGLFAAAYERGDIREFVAGHDHYDNNSGMYMGIRLSYDASIGYDVYGSDRLRGGRLLVYNAEDDTVKSEHVYLKNLSECDWITDTSRP